MKTIITLLMLSVCISASSQNLSLENPIYEDNGIRLELKECTEFKTIVKYQSIGENGIILQEGNYRDGKRDGMWYMYDYQGNVTSTMIFKMDQKIKLTSFDSSGEEITVFYSDNKPVKRISIAYLD